MARQLFEPALHTAPDPGALAQGPAGLAARLLGFPGAPPAAGDDPVPDPLFAILHGLYWLTANLAAEAPLCLVVDDAHWSDAGSLRFLNLLLTRVEELPVGVLLAMRPGKPVAAVEQLAALASDPAVELVRPSPLGPAAAARILEAGLGAPPEPGFVAACEAATGGIPLLLHELTAGLREEGIAPVDAAAARVRALGLGRVGPWVRTGLGRLPPDAVTLAHAVAVLEEAGSPTAAALAGLDTAGAAAGVEALTAVGLLRPAGPLAFVHPMVRAPILDAIPAAARARAHRRGEAAQAHLLLGDAAAARRLAAEEVALARAFGAPRTLGVALRAAGVVDGDAPRLRDAIAELDRAGAGLDAARARTDLGALLRRGNHGARARELLALAVAEAERLGGTLVLRRAEVELAATGARSRHSMPSGRDALTASERRVAELAAEGRTNRDIAQMLFVTAKTVEGHLRHVYVKLGVPGREALPDALR